jgi:1-acyl-sn-glycerol-3-phosphate acyltransferase
MAPMYGLAECAVALALTPLGRGPRIDRARTRAAAGAVERVSCGTPLPGHEIRIVDDSGREVGDRDEGRIEFRGPSATSGYFRDPANTAALYHGTWLDTGDLGYIAEGELYVTGRIKDIIIRAGRNLHPEEIEAVVGDIAAVRKGRVAVFPSADARTGTERLVVLAETRLRDPEPRTALVAEIGQAVADVAELPPDEVVLAPPGTVLKTANGKIRRAACRALYEEGRIGRPPPALWQQLLGLMRASVRPALRRGLRALGALAYAIWFQAVYRLLAVPVWLLVATLPGVRRRRRVLRGAGRVMLRLLGLGPDVVGAENLPGPHAHLLVTNHASFLDVLALAAVLPPDFAFVAKRELGDGLIGGRFLKRLGTAFVERIDPAAGVEDTRSLIGALGRGQALVFFPEGTFDRRPGLRAFHMGAFVAAAEAGVPVVPVAIRGTRAILRGDSAFARRGRIGVLFGRPLSPGGRDWRAALDLRDRARKAVLAACGEPDLIDEAISIPAS